MAASDVGVSVWIKAGGGGGDCGCGVECKSIIVSTSTQGVTIVYTSLLCFLFIPFVYSYQLEEHVTDLVCGIYIYIYI